MKKNVASTFAVSGRTVVLLGALLSLTVFGLMSFKAGAQEGSWYEFSYPIEPEASEPNGKETSLERTEGNDVLLTTDLEDVRDLGDHNFDGPVNVNIKGTRKNVSPGLAAPNGTVSAGLQGEIEPNGTSGTATAITTPAKVRGNIYPNADADYYSFTANSGDRVYAAVMTSGSSNASSDSQLRLFASDGTTLIEFDDDDGSLGNFSSSIAGASITSTGTYYLVVNHFSATNQLRPYDLYVRLQSGAPVPEVESNDTPATANPLPASGWVSGTRNPGTDVDFFSMTLNAGDTVYLGLDLDPENDTTTFNGRLGIALFGDANNQILVVDDTGTTDTSDSEAAVYDGQDGWHVFRLCRSERRNRWAYGDI